MNALETLGRLGQAAWYDNVSRDMIHGGLLKKLIAGGITGVTSNPAIFERAICQSKAYDNDIHRFAPKCDAPTIFRTMAIDDVRDACNLLRPVYDRSAKNDGFVSIEVSPHLADDIEGSIAEARELWQRINRPNLLIKVPSTEAGTAVLRRLIAANINVNATLLFSRQMYEKMAYAYLEGLEENHRQDLGTIASCASFFISRIDARIDALLAEKITSQAGKNNDRLAALKGKTAIANAKLAYASYRRIFSGPRWDALAARGAKPQRLLWASTGTKGKDYSDVLYVEELIGPNTVNTMPPDTMTAYLDHGEPQLRLEDGLEAAKADLAALETAGISLDAVTAELLADGLKKFSDAANSLYAAIESKRRA